VTPEILASLAAFSAAALLLTIAPGLDTALVLRTSTGEGPRPAFAAALGIGSGCLVWAAIVALGLGALLAASQLAYTVLRWIGAGYLCWVGFRLILKPRTSFDPGVARPGDRGGLAAFFRGFLTNILNPKVGVFYVSFLPQFVPHGVPVAPFVMLLGALHVVMGVAWLSILIGATRPLARLLRKPAVLKALDRLTGLVFLAFGARLALESRR
jgi:threonine/homoserine/homoserine lactone efflux protein